jgi:uncharacterized protein with von Willebrand factor type A (vWA) domain
MGQARRDRGDLLRRARPGSPESLAIAIASLRRLCFRLVWVSPHAGAAVLPVGLTVARPHIDLLVPGRDLRDLTRLATLLAGLR